MRSAFAHLLLATGLVAQSPEPGAPPGFRERVLGYLATDPMDLWRKELRRPVFTAVVEIVGELSHEEKQQLAFEEMRARLLADIRAMLRDTGPERDRTGFPNLFTLARMRF